MSKFLFIEGLVELNLLECNHVSTVNLSHLVTYHIKIKKKDRFNYKIMNNKCLRKAF